MRLWSIRGSYYLFRAVSPESVPQALTHRLPSARTVVFECFCPLSGYLCPLVANPFWCFLAFFARGVAKVAKTT